MQGPGGSRAVTHETTDGAKFDKGFQVFRVQFYGMSQLFLTLHGISGFMEAAAIIIKADCVVSEDFTTVFVAGQGFFYFFLGMQQVAEIVPGLAVSWE